MRWRNLINSSGEAAEGTHKINVKGPGGNITSGPLATDGGTLMVHAISNKRWKQHEKAGEDMPLHRAIKEQGIENFSFEVIKTVEYIDSEQLLIIESCYMDKYDSITNGFNTKHSVDMFNVY
jgi:hypothetical protein